MFLMLVLFYLPFALRSEQESTIKAGNVMLHRNPLVVVNRTLVRNWVYIVYAIFPALALMTVMLNSMENGRIVIKNHLNTFSCICIATYTVFFLVSLFLGKLGFLKPGRFLLSIVGCVLVLCIFYGLIQT